MTEDASRRTIILRACAAIAWFAQSRPASAQLFSCPTHKMLDSKLFESGDLLFPKTPGRLIPFNQGVGESDTEAWQRGRSEIIAELEALAAPSADDRALLQHLQSLERSFAEFRAVYEFGLDPERDKITPHGGSALDPREHSGHAAIVEVLDGGQTNIIEAIGAGVQRLSFASWLSKRSSERIWHKRVNAQASRRQDIVKFASLHVGKPYSLGSTISSYRLDDPRTFYCSKLAWLSVMAACDLPLDENRNTFRVWPISPLTLVNSRHLLPVHDQGNYRVC